MILRRRTAVLAGLALGAVLLAVGPYRLGVHRLEGYCPRLGRPPTDLEYVASALLHIAKRPGRATRQLDAVAPGFIPPPTPEAAMARARAMNSGFYVDRRPSEENGTTTLRLLFGAYVVSVFIRAESPILLPNGSPSWYAHFDLYMDKCADSAEFTSLFYPEMPELLRSPPER